MRNTKMLKHQLMALQANCASTVQNIQSIIAMIDQDVEEHKSAQVNSECQHPHQFLQDIRTMGNTHRFFCTKCKQKIEVEDNTLLEMANQGSI